MLLPKLLPLKTHEVCMESVPGGVSERVHKGLRIAIPIVREVAGSEDEFVKDRDHGHRVARWAGSAIVMRAVRVRHVRFVVSRIKIHSVPARRKVDLRAEAAWAISLWKSGLLGFVSSETDVGDSLLGKARGIKST